MTVVWKTIALHCEACGVDCCDDCRLQVDVKLPCGSEEAQKAVSEAFQNKLTVDNLLHAMAPFDGHHTKPAAVTSAIDEMTSLTTTNASGALDVSGKSPRAAPAKEQKRGGCGTMKLEFLRAHILDEPVPAETDPLSLIDRRVRPGEYFVRVSWTGEKKTVRTRTIQSNGRPNLASGLMKFLV